MNNPRTPKGPILPMLGAYAKMNPARFHMPGHKGFLNPLDVTEIAPTDNLLIPSGTLKVAQQELAAAYGAQAAFFSTGGATACVVAMLLTLPEGSAVALGRNSHRSAVSGLILGGHQPVWLLPEHANGESGQISPAAVGRAFAANPNIRAVLITSPDYKGRCADLLGIAAVCREFGAKLLVDGAHGAHFALSPALPDSPGLFADIWAASAHKTLPCQNQGAYLFTNGNDADRLKTALFTVHTTSPSFPLLAELDEAWRAAKNWDYPAHIARVNAMRGRIAQIAGLDPAPAAGPGVAATDETRLAVSVSGRGVTGFAAEEHLAAQGVFMEMADADGIVAITTPDDPDEWYDRLIEGLQALPQNAPLDCPEHHLTHLPPAAMIPRKAAFLPRELVLLEHSAGRVCAESFGVYPPGCAAAAPGEVIDEPCLLAVLQAKNQGGTLFGVTEGKVSVILA